MNKYHLPNGGTSDFHSEGSRLFPGRGEYMFAVQF